MALRTAHRHLYTALQALCAVAMVLLAGAVPAAHALDPRLEYSTDGTTWIPAPPEALFDADLVLVPGESATATLHLRSTAPTTGDLEVALTDVRTTSRAAAESFGIRTTIESSRGAARALADLPRTRFVDLGEHTSVGSAIALEPGQSARVSLTVDLAALPQGTAAQNSAVDLDLALSFRDSLADNGDGGGGQGVGTGGPSDESPTSYDVIPLSPSAHPQAPAVGFQQPPVQDGLLAVTGIARSAIIAAIAVTVAGGMLVLVSRRREEDS